MGFLDKIFGTKTEREVKRIAPVVEQVSALETEMQALTDDELRAKTDAFRARIRQRLELIADEPDAEKQAFEILAEVWED